MMPISATGIWSRREGFTLVELAVVLVILGIVVTLVLPRLATIGQGALKENAGRLAISIKSLYNEAALSGQTHLLVLQLGQGSYEVHRMVPKGEVLEEVAVGEPRELAGDVRFRNVWVRGQGVTSSGEVKLPALPVGWIAESAIYLQDDDGGVVTLHINPLDGLAEVYEEDRSF